MQRLEREILELPLERVDTEAVGERRVHLERLARLLHLLLLAEELDRAEVVQAVGEVDPGDAEGPRPRDRQPPVLFGVRVLRAPGMPPGQLPHAPPQRRAL